MSLPKPSTSKENQTPSSPSATKLMSVPPSTPKLALKTILHKPSPEIASQPGNRRSSTKDRRESTPTRAQTPPNRGQSGKRPKTPTIALTISDIIRKKRNGESLHAEEVTRVVNGIVDGSMHQVQIGAMLMAIYLRGMNTDETFSLTKALTRSGRAFKWPDNWHRLVVDKHSTGGGGDKLSLILAPVLAVCGLKIPMITTRTLEATNGILDKLETIPGIQVKLSAAEIKSILTSVGCCIVSESDEILPADQLIYKYRDITSTMESPPLIIASAISKKAAEGLSALVLDIKYGRGSIIKSKEDARNLAYAMVNMGYKMGIKTSAVISSIEAPLGNTMGNSLEVAEALQSLKGGEKTELVELAMKLGGELLYLLGATSRKEGAEVVGRVLKEGVGVGKFRDMIIAQGVKTEIARKLCDNKGDVWSVLPKAPYLTTLYSHASGYVHHIDSYELNRAIQHLGSGKGKQDNGIGVELLVHIGSSIYKGQTWMKIYHAKQELGDSVISSLQHALVVRSTDVLTPISRVSEIITQQ